MKKEIKIASVKGHFIDNLNTFLSKLGIGKDKLIDKKSKKLKYEFDLNDKYYISVVLLRWYDLKKYSKEFDLLLFGSDQWIESGLKSIIILDSFKQDTTTIAIMSQDGKYSEDKPVATSFPTIASSYLYPKIKNIKFLSGSVEAAHYLGIADQIVDVFETGETSKENGYRKVTDLISLDAVIGTTYMSKIPLFQSLGIIPKKSEPILNIAFDGIDNSGKSVLARHLVVNRFNSNPSVLVEPYSGYIGTESMAFLDDQDCKSWFLNIGTNHWRTRLNVNAVYDRNIITGLTELVEDYSAEEIKQFIKSWEPLPDILVYCTADIEILIDRALSRKDADRFDKRFSIIKYNYLYKKAIEFAETYLNIKIVKIDTGDTYIVNNLDLIKYYIDEYKRKNK